MPQYWISFRSLTHAQRAARFLEKSGITATVTRLPQGVSPKGCGYASSSASGSMRRCGSWGKQEYQAEWSLRRRNVVIFGR